MLAAVPAAGDEDPPEPRESFEQQDLTVLVSLKDSLVPSLVPSPSPALLQPFPSPSVPLLRVRVLLLQEGMLSAGSQHSAQRQRDLC